MKLVDERVKQTMALAEALSSRPAAREDLRTIKELIADEQESMEKSRRIADTDSYNAQYRRNMRKAVDNSALTIEHLQQAHECVKRRDNNGAQEALNRAVEHRSKRARQPARKDVSKLYAEFQARRDKEFHKWLADNGHTDVLNELGVASASARVKQVPERDSYGNRM